MRELEALTGLVLAAIILAAAARRVGAPYPVFLALGGAILAFVQARRRSPCCLSSPWRSSWHPYCSTPRMTHRHETSRTTGYRSQVWSFLPSASQLLPSRW